MSRELNTRAITAIEKFNRGVELTDRDLDALSVVDIGAVCPPNLAASVGCLSGRLRTVCDFVIRQNTTRRELWIEIADAASNKFKPIDIEQWLSRVALQTGDVPPAIAAALDFQGQPAWSAVADRLARLFAPKKREVA